MNDLNRRDLLRRTVEVTVTDGEITKIEVPLSPDDLPKWKAVKIP